MHEPAAWAARPAQQVSVHIGPAARVEDGTLPHRTASKTTTPGTTLTAPDRTNLCFFNRSTNQTLFNGCRILSRQTQSHKPTEELILERHMASLKIIRALILTNPIARSHDFGTDDEELGVWMSNE